MNITMSYPINYINRNLKSEKKLKYVDLHKNLKNKAKIFRKKYDIEKALDRKEAEANECCNIFNDRNDDKCMDIWEDIEELEQKLKTIEKKLEFLRNI